MKYEMKEILFLFSVSYSSNPDAKVTGIGIDRNFPCIHWWAARIFHYKKNQKVSGNYFCICVSYCLY